MKQRAALLLAILLHFGDGMIPGVLNDSETAQALTAGLPYTPHMNRTSRDFCGGRIPRPAARKRSIPAG